MAKKLLPMLSIILCTRRLVNGDEKTAYHNISRTALEGFSFGPGIRIRLSGDPSVALPRASNPIVALIKSAPTSRALSIIRT